MPSFDIVSRTEMTEVDNAVQGAMREIGTRYDFKGSSSTIERNDETLLIKTEDDLKLKQVQELLRGHMAKRKVDVGVLDFKEPEKAFGNSLRQTVLVKQGIERDLAQKIVKTIKGSKVKVQVAIQGDELRVSGKKRDDLQAAIALIKESKIDQPLQYINFRDSGYPIDHTMWSFLFLRAGNRVTSIERNISRTIEKEGNEKIGCSYHCFWYLEHELEYTGLG